MRSPLRTIGLWVAMAAPVWAIASEADDSRQPAKPAAKQPAKQPTAAGDHKTESLRGRIVWLNEALNRRFEIMTVPEAKERVLAIETKEGGLHPLVEDIRGRSFRKDARLRELADVELLVRRFRGSPAVQVIRIYSHEKSSGKKVRLEIDYWCEICAIAMFELKACDCCQGDIELRKAVRK